MGTNTDFLAKLAASQQAMSDSDELKLTERELQIARKAADIAVKQVMDNFYREVGRSFINRWLIIIGAAVVAYGAGKGWINPFVK